jgi:hypothetical protein
MPSRTTAGASFDMHHKYADVMDLAELKRKLAAL